MATATSNFFKYYNKTGIGIHLNKNSLQPTIAPKRIEKIRDAATEGMGEWTEILSPQRSLWQLRLGEVWRYKDLLFLFVRRDFVSQYKQTILGPLWHFIQPMLTTLMFMLVFHQIAGIGTGSLPAPLFFISSLAIWNYFQACFTGTAATFTANAGIFGKVYFPRLIMPLSVVASNLIKLAVQFCLLVLVLVYVMLFQHFRFVPGWHLLLLPLLIAVMATMGLGLGIIVSSLTTKYKDLAVLIGFGVQLLMYVTPVPYPLAFIKDKPYRHFIEWNPLSPLVEGFRYSLFGDGIFSTAMLMYSVVCSIVFLLAGVVIFNKVERSFMDTV